MLRTRKREIAMISAFTARQRSMSNLGIFLMIPAGRASNVLTMENWTMEISRLNFIKNDKGDFLAEKISL